MGRPKKYTPKTLEKAVNRYFASISRVVTVTEPKDTGEKDKWGHKIYEQVPVKNSLGKEVTMVEYVIPPSFGELALFLGISISTWNSYCNEEEFQETTTRARGRIRAYLDRELLTRTGKNLKGVIFDLQNNHGCMERVEIDDIRGSKNIQALADILNNPAPNRSIKDFEE